MEKDQKVQITKALQQAIESKRIRDGGQVRPIMSSDVTVTRSASIIEAEKQNSISSMNNLIDRIKSAIGAMSGVSGDIGSGDETSQSKL